MFSELFVHLTINFPTEERGFISSVCSLGCAMVGLVLLDGLCIITVCLLLCKDPPKVARNGGSVSLMDLRSFLFNS